jgi:glycosyltransferase involved in cell wall biosynthesis
MRILYDGQIFRLQPAGGINRYFASLISRLPQDDIPTIAGAGRRPVNFPTHPNLRLNRLLPVLPGRFSGAYLRHARPPFPTWDVAHPTYYQLTRETRYSDYKMPVVVTAHDFIHALYPDLMIESKAVAAQQTEAFEAAAAIICVSQNTRNDLLSFFPHLENKTTVIYHGIEVSGDLPAASESVPEEPYFLYVGSRSSYKNFNRLLVSFAKACNSDPTLRLCVAGPDFSESERWLIFDLGLKERILSVRHPSDAHLTALYRHSLALLYPSRYEGFGIPPLEAMACGTVAVTSNTSSLPEVVGDAGITLDPMNPDDWTDIILHLARSPEIRQPFIEKGKLQSAKFTWEETARQTVAVYQKVQNL